jgi:[acyl-carrier-protein] S-malonyltransferase
MKQTAVVIAPGRGTYNKNELGYLKRYHANAPNLEQFDAYRATLGQKKISELDTFARFSDPIHTRGDNAAPLIYACAYSDFVSIDRDLFEIVGITGNSMGWYIALACAGALDPMGGMQVVNTMGTLMQVHMIGGQLIYPFLDDNWQEIPGRRDNLLSEVATINARPEHDLGLSIDLGGMLVLAGNEAGLTAFERSVPALQGRFPMRLQNHAGFHTHLQRPISKLGFDALSEQLFVQPTIPIIDGRGAIWYPNSTDTSALYNYTLGHQVVEPYDFTAAIRTAAREFMPDVFIVLGPGTTLGGATAQALILANWRGCRSKLDFQKEAQIQSRVVLQAIMNASV